MSTHHTIDYIEISSTDIAVARRFYEEAFGWQFTEYSPTYLGIQKPGGGEMGGLWQAEQVTPGGPLVVLYSDDLEASEMAVKDAGGQISKEIFSFPGGRRFHFTDPSGHELAVWSHS
ncbi:MAG: VOC family protein [Bradymonadia bacterium]